MLESVKRGVDLREKHLNEAFAKPKRENQTQASRSKRMTFNDTNTEVLLCTGECFSGGRAFVRDDDERMAMSRMRMIFFF